MPPAIPRATYRLQLTSKFGFYEAARVVPYLQRLGISHVYASPFLKARAGSQHGYDIIDHNTLNPEFGGEEGFAVLSDALAGADMGLILDFVPNHMGVGHADNAWWLDVLEWGQKSSFARVFDIEWETLPYRAQGGVLLPILGTPYGEALESGEIKLRYDAETGGFAFWYFDHRLPVRPDRYTEILRAAVVHADAAGEPAGQKILDLAGRYATPGAPSRAQAPAFRQALVAIPGAAKLIEDGLRAYDPLAGNAAAKVTLHRLLERQHYRLAHWRVAISEINYRRFFDINDLAGIRVEDFFVFRLIHRKVAELIEAGKLHGLRLDHIDGLYDPAQYCHRLRRFIGGLKGARGREPFYVVVEKILAPDENMLQLPGVAGTTGYDVLNLMSRVLTDQKGLPVLEHTWQTQGAPSRNFQQMVEDAKSLVITSTMSSEFTVLARLLSRIAAGHWPSRDYTLDRLRAALEFFVLHFPIYRTYIAGNSISDADRATIAQAISAARERWYGSDIAIFDFLQDVLTLDIVGPGRTGYSSARVKRFASKIQQFTGPVTAKAVEDTAFYRYHRLLALNEVGNDPALPALSVAEFHKAMIARAQQAPLAMTATATHDTKRGEDARTRLLALSEISQEWSGAVRRWTALNAKLIPQTKQRAPSRAHEYLLYQALIGAWQGAEFSGAFVERMKAYALKAAREGKQDTSWVNPNENYENDLARFIERLLDRTESAEFLDDFGSLAERVGRLGALNSLSQLALKAMLPGIPDFYQGTEFWDLSLVDPDNRRPVDFDARASMLTTNSDDVDAATDGWPTGKTKFALTRRLLALRQRWPAVFADGSYAPVAALGPHGEHVIAFARVLDGTAIITAVGRHFAPLTEDGRHWPQRGRFEATLDLSGYRVSHDVLRDTEMAPGENISVADIFGDIPVAVLQAQVR